MKKILPYLLSLTSLAAYAQVAISSGTQLQTNQGTQILIQTPNNISNNSASADFSNAILTFDLIGGTQNITGAFTLFSLQTHAAGSKTINDALTITDNISFSAGILTASGNGKLLFTGPSSGITGGDNSSYYDGVFYSSGSGSRIFPVGTAGTYTPLIFESVTGETGVRVRNENAALSTDGVEITSVDQDRFWEITTDPSLVNSNVSLSLNGLDAFNAGDGATAVVQSSAIGGQAVNLSSSSIDDASVTSRINVTSPILTVAKEKQIIVKVHNLITPFGSSGMNDQLFIENIEKFEHNKVTLLDRWGVKVNEWKNFTNDDPYDFSKLGPGNYICVVEYGNNDGPSKSIEQMVSVLKTN